MVLSAAASLNCRAASLWWTGLVNTNWDVNINTNWENAGGDFVMFNNGDAVTFDIHASGVTNIWLATNVQPASVTVDTSTRNFIFNGTNAIYGNGALTKINAGTLTINNSNSFSGGLIIGGGQVTLTGGYGAGSGTITLSNGATLYENSPGQNVTPGNAIAVAAGATATIQNNNISPGFGGNISSGDSTAVLTINLASLPGNADQLDNFSGTVNIGASSVRFSSLGGGSNGGTNATFNLIGSLYSRNPLTQNLGALTGAGTLQGAGGSAPGNSTIFIGAKNINSTFTGTISEGSASSHTSITKVGTGTLTLAGTNAYTGSTTVSGGTLTLTNTAIIGSGTSSNTTVITVNGGAALNLAGPSPFNQLTIATNQTLKGGGVVIAASVTVPLGGIVLPGDGVGTLTVSNGTAISAGTMIMELNRTNSPATNDQLKASAITINGGTLIVTNLGPDLHSGDSFKLFSVAIGGSGFNTVSLPASNAVNTVQYVWTNQLAASGTIQLLATIGGVNTNAVTLTNLVSGTNLFLSWPADHIGWRLLAQTNNLAKGISANTDDWGTVANSAATNRVTQPVDVTKPAEFYRLVYP